MVWDTLVFLVPMGMYVCVSSILWKFEANLSMQIFAGSSSEDPPPIGIKIS